MASFLSAIGGYGAMLTSLVEECSLPVLCLCHGATRGGGMLFPAISDLVIASEDATFGFPEVRRGVLPGVVSVPAMKRLTQHQCRRWMLTGDVMSFKDALNDGFVDIVAETKPNAEIEVYSSRVFYLIIADVLYVHMSTLVLFFILTRLRSFFFFYCIYLLVGSNDISSSKCSC